MVVDTVFNSCRWLLQNRGEACISWGGVVSRSSHWQQAQRSWVKRNPWEPVQLRIWQVWEGRHLVLRSAALARIRRSHHQGEKEGKRVPPPPEGTIGGGNGNRMEKSRVCLGRGCSRPVCWPWRITGFSLEPSAAGSYWAVLSGDDKVTFALWKGPWLPWAKCVGERPEETVAVREAGGQCGVADSHRCVSVPVRDACLHLASK